MLTASNNSKVQEARNKKQNSDLYKNMAWQNARNKVIGEILLKKVPYNNKIENRNNLIVGSYSKTRGQI